MLNIKITMMILFANIFLALLLPGVVFNNAILFEQDNFGNYELSTDYTQPIEGISQNEGGLSVNNFGILDGVKMFFGLIELFVRLVFASIIIAYSLPVPINILVGFPIAIAYGFSIMGAVR